ncbi:MAG: hypothetical protein QG599_648 [Pseudomonadota bacterium]|nr:hypothetical protein [Pseudomonadota bacterium]
MRGFVVIQAKLSFTIFFPSLPRRDDQKRRGGSGGPLINRKDYKSESPLSVEVIGIEMQISAMGQQSEGLTAAVYSGKSDMDSPKRRVEPIEQRLELHDAA